MSDWVVIGILVIVLLLAMFIVPQFLIARSMKKVIQIFKENNAVGVRHAKTAEELGLQEQNMFQRLMRPRDYKPRAMQYLMQVGILEMTEDGKLYLVEENLVNTRFGNTG
jgi:hypothetical protein